jgi:hypothetical protein
LFTRSEIDEASIQDWFEIARLMTNPCRVEEAIQLVIRDRAIRDDFESGHRLPNGGSSAGAAQHPTGRSRLQATDQRRARLHADDDVLDRTAPLARNAALELHVPSRKSLADLH